MGDGRCATSAGRATRAPRKDRRAGTLPPSAPLSTRCSKPRVRDRGPGIRDRGSGISMPTNIVVPELGESVVEARVAKWLKKQGESVNAGDPLVELETEKIDLEVSADRAGVLGNIKHQEGEDVKVGEVLAVLEETSKNGKTAASVPKVPEVPEVPEVPKGSVPKAVPGSTEKKATPTARNVAKAHDVKLESVEPSGPRVTKQDVLKAAAPAQTAKPQAPSPRAQAPSPKPQVPVGERAETRERMSKRRATIARRLVEAQQTAAMLTTFNE